MLMEDGYKEVYFSQYCGICKFMKRGEDDEPCCECLNNPVNLNSHKPVKWQVKE